MSKKELLANTIDTINGYGLVRRVNRWSGLVVLNYHRIGEHGGSPFDWGLWSASLEDFEQQVRYLSLNFDIVSERDLPDIFTRKSGRFVMITFDDGYRDNYELAYPILRAYNVPAQFFLATGFLDNPRVPWWDEIAWMVRSSRKSQLPANRWTNSAIDYVDADRTKVIEHLLKIFKSLDAAVNVQLMNELADLTGSGRCPHDAAHEMWMTWDMVREMSQHMGIGGHTVNHNILGKLTPPEQEFEIRHCKERIETELGKPISTFSFPVGHQSTFDEQTRDYLRRYGFRYAFSFYGGYAKLNHADPLDIPRDAVESYIRFPEFQATVTLPQLYT
ncbi:MAG: polysaccharide deacetylase family protein [Planctomycetota bacterium]|nr:polysaccharide deacetylase family protein [Planctomycetota bacterium]MDA1212778.1 polysaccharide deacetylase family protein [Planctomycetota bacterium]